MEKSNQCWTILIHKVRDSRTYRTLGVFEPSTRTSVWIKDPWKVNNLLDIIISDSREDQTAEDLLTKYFSRENVPLFIPPQLFFQSDRPSDLLFRDPNKKAGLAKSTGQSESSTTNESTIGISRKPRKAFTKEVKFDEVNPNFEIPTQVIGFYKVSHTAQLI